MPRPSKTEKLTLQIFSNINITKKLIFVNKNHLLLIRKLFIKPDDMFSKMLPLHHKTHHSAERRDNRGRLHTLPFKKAVHFPEVQNNRGHEAT